MKLKYIIILLIIPLLSGAQEGFDAFIESIEANNKSLLAAKKLAEAEALEAKTGIYLSNPEVSYAHLNEESGYYSEMVVEQAFDFPSTYIHRSKIAENSEQQTFAKYRQIKTDIFAEAAGVYTRLVVVNRKLNLLYEIQDMMNKLKSNSETKLLVGEISIIEANRIRNETAKTIAELRILETERDNLILETVALNGGKTYNITDTALTDLLPSLDTDTIVQEIVSKHPATSYWNSELDIAEQNISLQKAVSLPKFQIGYRQDASSNGTNHGFVAGISIPLFENKNTVKLARAQQLYLHEEVSAEQLKLENSVIQMVQSYKAMQASVTEMEQVIATLNTPGLLIKSYEAGQINYTEFFTEYQNFRQTIMYIEELKQEVTALELRIHILLR